MSIGSTHPAANIFHVLYVEEDLIVTRGSDPPPHCNLFSYKTMISRYFIACSIISVQLLNNAVIIKKNWRLLRYFSFSQVHPGIGSNHFNCMLNQKPVCSFLGPSFFYRNWFGTFIFWTLTCCISEDQIQNLSFFQYQCFITNPAICFDLYFLFLTYPVPSNHVVWLIGF